MQNVEECSVVKHKRTVTANNILKILIDVSTIDFSHHHPAAVWTCGNDVTY